MKYKSMLLLLLALLSTQVSGQSITVLNAPSEHVCTVRGATPIQRLNSVLNCAFDEAKFESSFIRPHLLNKITAVPFPSTVKLVTKSPIMPNGTPKGQPVIGLTICAAYLSECIVTIQVTGDFYEDFDTAIHEFCHYLLVKSQDDYTMIDPFHKTMDSEGYHTLWSIRRAINITGR